MKHSLLARTGSLLLFMATGLNSYLSEAEDFAKEYVVKAAISLNLARFTEWPDNVLDANGQTVTLCVMGNQNALQAFAQMEKKPLGKRSIHVVAIDKPANAKPCHIIYVSELERGLLLKLLGIIAGEPKLSIGEQDDFLDLGGLVNLETLDGKINIKVNLDAVTKSGIKISSRVLALTTIVHGNSTGND